MSDHQQNSSRPNNHSEVSKNKKVIFNNDWSGMKNVTYPTAASITTHLDLKFNFYKKHKEGRDKQEKAVAKIII